ncbi:MAG: transporter substrate-binding domain-containing protein [Bacillota bacterium]
MRQLLPLLLLPALIACSSPSPKVPTPTQPPAQAQQPPAQAQQPPAQAQQSPAPAPEPPSPPAPPLKVAFDGGHGSAFIHRSEGQGYAGFYVDLIRAVGAKLGREVELLEEQGHVSYLFAQTEVQVLVGAAMMTDPAEQRKYGWVPFARWADLAVYSARTKSMAGVYYEPIAQRIPTTGPDPIEGIAVGSRRPINLAVRAADVELREALAGAVRDLRADGTLRTLSERWFPVYDDQWYAFLEAPSGPPDAPPRVIYISNLPSGYPSDLAFGSGLYVVVSPEGRYIAHSQDGQAWTVVEGMKGLWHRVLFAAGRFWAAGSDGVLASSPDGIAWEPVDPGVTDGWMDLRQAGDRLLLLGRSGYLLASADGLRWEGERIDVQEPASILAGPDRWLLVTRRGQTLLSQDGKSWRTAETIGSPGGRLLYGNGRWLSGANLLTDQLLWLPPAAAVAPPVVFGDGRFAALTNLNHGFAENHLWTSADGLEWTPHPEIKGGAGLWFANGSFVIYR